MSTLTIAQVAAQAGAPNATLQDVGRYPVQVQTASGKTRRVTMARAGGGLLLYTDGSSTPTLTVQNIVSQAGGSYSASVANYGHLPVSVRTRTGKVRPVVSASFNGSAVVLVTGK